MFMPDFFVRFSRAFLLVALLLLAPLYWSCSTQKDSFVNRAYHTVNAKYNGFFNARESYREGVLRLSRMHVDNYDQVLSVFRYGSEQQASSVVSYMDVAYEKASLVIRRHSMNIRGREHNKWIDESFFLIARSHFFKRDYTLAILTFEYIIRQYDTPRSAESKVWIAKCHHAQGRVEPALRMLEMAESDYKDGLMTTEGAALFRKTRADHYIRKGDYGAAAPHLEAAVQYVKNREEEARLTFILAQLYLHSGNYAMAQQTYARVLDMRPGYDMAFQARIGMAMAFDPDVGGGSNIRRELMSMLSDDRNKAYLDQIYYALAQLAMRQQQEKEAIGFYLESVQHSEGNELQKGLSFLRLGEIYFEHPDYLRASLYYDSATTYLPSAYDHYHEISQRHRVLSGLARNARVIEHEDSLQRLAVMPLAQQEALAREIIGAIREQDRLAEEEAREMRRAMAEAGRSARQTRGMGGQEGGWYFYNVNAVNQGKAEFFSRYGDRPLEDLWRISNRRMLAVGFEDGDEAWDDEAGQAQEAGDIYDINTYLRNIPNTEEQFKASNRRLVDAYYNMAIIFKDQLGNAENALSSFEALTSRFPGSERELYVYYYMYFLYRETGQPSRAEAVKNALVSGYPDSDFARILGDPDYAGNFRERQQQASRMYEESYHAFLSGRYEVIERHLQALDTMEVSREDRARFAYLHALSVGRSNDGERFARQLKEVVSMYEGTPVYGPATILLASLEAQPAVVADATDAGSFEDEDADEGSGTTKLTDSPFEYDPSKAHFFVLLVGADNTNPRQLRDEVTEYNRESHPEVQLSASSIFFEEGRQLITITNFDNKGNGMVYYQQITESAFFNRVSDGVIASFIISVDNYPAFYQDKLLESYQTFFRHYYLEP